MLKDQHLCGNFDIHGPAAAAFHVLVGGGSLNAMSHLTYLVGHPTMPGGFANDLRDRVIGVISDLSRSGNRTGFAQCKSLPQRRNALSESPAPFEACSL